MTSEKKLQKKRIHQSLLNNPVLVDFRDPLNWWDEARLHVSGNRLPSVGTPVFEGANLAGMVSMVDGINVWIKLITSSSLFIPVVVEDTRELGVIVGDGDGGVWLKYMPIESSYVAGTRLSTALGISTLPPGIAIGKLSGVRRESSPGVVEYSVVCGAELSKLQSVNFSNQGFVP